MFGMSINGKNFINTIMTANLAQSAIGITQSMQTLQIKKKLNTRKIKKD
jgi:hypothetical protein